MKAVSSVVEENVGGVACGDGVVVVWGTYRRGLMGGFIGVLGDRLRLSSTAPLQVAALRRMEAYAVTLDGRLVELDLESRRPVRRVLGRVEWRGAWKLVPVDWGFIVASRGGVEAFHSGGGLAWRGRSPGVSRLEVAP